MFWKNSKIKLNVEYETVLEYWYFPASLSMIYYKSISYYIIQYNSSMTILILNRTNAENYIKRTNKESFLKYFEVIKYYHKIGFDPPILSTYKTNDRRWW